MEPKISFIIPCLNSGKTVGDTVQSIFNLNGDFKFEVIVVDNGSDDETIEIVSKYPVVLVHCLKRGAGCARNAGINVAKGKYFAFIDSDVVLEKDWLVSLIPPMEKNNFSIALGKVIPDGKETFFNKFRLELNKIRYKSTSISIVHPINDVAPTVNTAACVYRGALVKNLHGFDERLSRLEDTDLSVRVFHHGGAIYASSEAVAWVYNTGGVWSYLKRSYKLGIARHELYQTSTYGLKTALNNYKSEIFHMKGRHSDFRITCFYFLNILMNFLGFLYALMLGKKISPHPISSITFIKILHSFSFELEGILYHLGPSSRLIVLDRTWFFFCPRRTKWFKYQKLCNGGNNMSDIAELEYNNLIVRG